jgi:pimeloyl-ACP methyl ester carboxylesterase
MHVDVHGPEAATPVVLLHGGTGTGDHHWRRVVRELGDVWRLLVPDLPGHGRSRLPPEGFNRDALVAAADDAIERAGAPAHVAGFSMGANAALQLATQRPQRFASLAVIGASVADHPGLAAWRARFDAETLARDHPLWARTMSRLHRPLGGDDAWRDVLARDAGGLDVDVDVDALARLACPLLILRGDRDPAVDSEQQARLRAAAGQHGEECVLPAGGHEVQMTRPRIVSVVLDDFWGRAAG